MTKVVKGGKNLSFSALVAVGNERGKVGIGKGKAREVPPAIAKAVENAKKNMIDVPLAETTIPHLIKGVDGAGVVVLRPASKGTGVIAGGAVRVIMQLAGIKDILTKSIRSSNPISVANATIDALKRLKSPEAVAKTGGKRRDGMAMKEKNRPGARGPDVHQDQARPQPDRLPARASGASARGLGLRKLNSEVVRPNTPGDPGHDPQDLPSS